MSYKAKVKGEIPRQTTCIACETGAKTYVNKAGFRFTYCYQCLRKAQVGPFRPRLPDLEYDDW